MALTAWSTSSPVRVRSGWRKVRPKWTLCSSSARLPPWKVSRYSTAARVGPAASTTAAARSAQLNERATTSDRSRTTAGNGGKRTDSEATSSACSHQDVELELGRRAGAAELECRELAGIDLAQVAEVSVAQQELGGAAGGEEGDLDRLRRQGRGDVQPRQERLDARP